MNKDELIVFNYLQLTHGTNIVFEPNGNKSPDFLLNSNIAIEVRRLNQNFFSKDKSEGLETLTNQITGAIKEVLVSFDSLFLGKSYLVNFKYKRPFTSSIKKFKYDLKKTLSKIIVSNNFNTPNEIQINKSVLIEVTETSTIEGGLFRLGGQIDHNSGGFVISKYIENIHHCIHAKSEKIKSEKYRYKLWYLYLVDHLNLGLDFKDIIEVKRIVANLEEFDKLVLVNREGKLIFEII